MFNFAQLEKRFKKVKLPKLPGKRWFGNNNDMNFVHKRMRYVNLILACEIQLHNENRSLIMQHTLFSFFFFFFFFSMI